MLAAGYVFRPDNAALPPFTLPVVLMLIGGAMLGAAIFITRKREHVALPRAAAPTPTRSDLRCVGLGVVLLAITAEMSGQAIPLKFLSDVSIHVQHLVWLSGIATLWYGMSGAPRLRLPRYDPRHVAALALIVLLAFALRAVALDRVIWQSIDEVHWMDGVRMISWEQDRFELLRSPSGYQAVTAVYTYWTAGTTALFGHNWVGIRFANTIIGTLTVAAMYGLGRALFDRRMGLIAALMLAVFPPHIHYSRIALAHITDAFIAAALILFVVRGLRWGKPTDWAAAGVMLGLSQYFFESGRLLFPVVTVIWFAALIVFTPNARRHWYGMAVVVLIGIVMALPVYYTLAGRSALATARLDHSSSIRSEWLPLIQDGVQAEDVATAARLALTPFLFYVHAREYVDFWGGNTSLMHPLLVPLFLIGVFYCAGRWRSPLHIFPIIIIAVGLGNALLANKWGSPRYIVVMPALAFMIAVGARYGLALLIPGDTFALVRPRLGEKARLRYGHLLMILIGVIAVFSPIYYFREHIPILNQRLLTVRPYPDMFDAAMRAAWQFEPESTQVWLISRVRADFNIARGAYGYFAATPGYNLETIAAADVTGDWLVNLPRDRAYVFMIEPGLNEIAARLSFVFPTMHPPRHSLLGYPLPPEKEFFAYYVPLDAQ